MNKNNMKNTNKKCRTSVGAVALKSAHEKGITLIALVITIIVMLILVVVTINMAVNGGLFGYAGNATRETKDARDAELGLADLEDGLTTDELIEKYTGEGAPEWLKKYVLGDSLQGQSIMNILDMEALGNEQFVFTNDNVIFMNMLSDTNTGYMYLKYENIAYKVTVGLDYITKSVKKVYEPKANSWEGRQVPYSVDGTAPATDWVVLYDNGDTVDIMKITPMDSLTLGSGDEETTGSTPLEKAINSYNSNIAHRLNSYCASLITNSTAIKVRSIGSKPDFSETDTNSKYSSEILEGFAEGAYNGVGKVGDMNAEQDVVRMSYYSEGDYETYGYANAGTYYWLASRSVYEDPDYVYFGVRCVDGDGFAIYNYLWFVNSEGADSNVPSDAVRPVVRVLKEDLS